MAIGFGPQHGSAVLERPAARPRAFNGQTWFRDASAAGATDGTVADASWLNHMLGNLIYLCDRGSVDPDNEQNDDTLIYRAVAAIVTALINGVAGLSSVATDETLQGDGRSDAPLGLSDAVVAQLATIADLAAAIAAERARAIGVEANLDARIKVLERGEAPRASSTSFGFARLGEVSDDAPSGGVGWQLI